MKFGIMFFASSEEALSGNKYRLIMESALFADSHGFSSVWVPERHFTEFGSLYPNPAVLHAALAVSTNRIRLLAGSVVAPLHHPIRIAEEWSMVDNLSNGRVGISFASGWNPDDFIFSPDKYADRHNEMLANISTVQQLWRGGTTRGQSGKGNPAQVRIYPTPVQRELPIWLTAASNPQTFIRAGEIGANLLTHVLDQDRDQLAQKIALYRDARSRNGWEGAGTVTVMLHTFVGSDAALVREQARAPFCNYIRRNAGLLNGLAQSRGQQVDVSSMPARELDEFIEFLYERFAHSRGLIGTPESCLGLIQSLEAIGVDEAACLLDFGPPGDLILENLPHLLRLQQLSQKPVPAARPVTFDPLHVQARCREQISGTEFNAVMREYGLHIDGEFQAIQQIWRRAGEALGKVALPVDAGLASSSTYEVNPAFLDACSRVLAAAVNWNAPGPNGLYLPGGVGLLRVHRHVLKPEAWSHATLRASPSPDSLLGDVRIYDPEGQLLIDIEGLRLQRLPSERRVHQDLASLLYRREWTPLFSLASADSPTRGEWLIFADRQGAGENLAAALRKAGNRCSLISSGSGAQELVSSTGSLKGIVHLGSLDLSPGDAEGRKRVIASLLGIVKTLASANGSAQQPRLWIATSGAMPVLEGETPAIAQSYLWGIGNAIAIEHPSIWGGLIDLDPSDLANPALVQTLESPKTENGIALRQGARYGARIRHVDHATAIPGKIRFHNEATYLITGGTGGIGLRLATWLFARGAGQVVLIGRSTPKSEAGNFLQESGAQFILADLSSRDDTTAAIAEIKRTMPPLKGIFHVAGTLDDALLIEQDIDRFHRAGSGKADGAWNLHELTSDLPLEHFVLFSSLASLVTMAGQANYAAANSFLDALAHFRRSQGKAALSINWGPWAEIGHATTDYGRRAHEQLASLGISPVSPELAIASLERLMTLDAVQAGVADVDWRRLTQADPVLAASPLLSGLLQSLNPSVQQETKLLIDLQSCPADDRPDFVMSVLAEMLAEVLRLPGPETVSRSQSLFDLGLDSILALELTNRISTSFGRPFRATLFFTCQTLAAVADHILAELSPVLGGSSPGEDSDDLSEEELSQLISEEISR